MTARLLGAAVTHGALVCLIASCAQYSGSAQVGNDVTTPNGLAQFLENRYTAAPYSETFAGVVLDADGVVVYRTVPSSAIDHDVARLNDARVVLRPAPNSARRLQEVSDRIAADRRLWSSQGVTISSLSARPDGSAVEVGVDPAGAAGIVASRYLGQPIEVVARRITLVRG